MYGKSFGDRRTLTTNSQTGDQERCRTAASASHLTCIGAQSAAAAARQLLGPFAKACLVDGGGRQQGFTTTQIEYFQAELPSWFPTVWRQMLEDRVIRRWGGVGFVCKRFTVGQEALVLRCLCLRSLSRFRSPASWPVPRVLGLRTEVAGGWALLEDVPRVGESHLTTTAEARLLAEQIVVLQRFLAEAERDAQVHLARHELLINPFRLRRLCRKADDPELDISGLMGRVVVLRDRLLRAPICLSHNDIGPGNMAIQKESVSSPSIRFIDFGTTAYNVVGADLHHYAVWALESQDGSAFFEALARSYAALIGQSEGVVRAGAQAYALERLVMRWWRRKDRRRFPARARAFLAQIVPLLAGAEADLARASQGG